MRVLVVGLRGLPGVEGGVETHAEHLYPLLANKGCEIEIIIRSNYVPINIGNIWCGVRLRRFWAPRNTIDGLEALIHSLIAVFYACLKRPDILHIHSIGPAIFSPIARILGLRVVVTHHGQEYEREKWGLIGRLILRTGELLAIYYSNQCIAISKIIEERVRTHFNRKAVFIPNGVDISEKVSPGPILRKFGLVPNRYVLMVSRIDPVKRQIDLIKAFAKADLKDWRLAIVGGIPPMDNYTKSLFAAAETVPGTIFTGFQTGTALKELYSNAGIFVLPSSQEGMPMVLLEALSFGLPVIASDIPGNRTLGLPAEHYFPLGDVKALNKKLREFSTKQFNQNWRESLQLHVGEKYNWDSIAEKTLYLYSDLLNKNKIDRISNAS